MKTIYFLVFNTYIVKSPEPTLFMQQEMIALSNIFRYGAREAILVKAPGVTLCR